MRAAAAIDATTELLRHQLPDDVATAIITDTDPFQGAARALGLHCTTLGAIAATVTRITHAIDDGTADWLVERADSPGAWFFSQVNNELGTGRR